MSGYDCQCAFRFCWNTLSDEEDVSVLKNCFGYWWHTYMAWHLHQASCRCTCTCPDFTILARFFFWEMWHVNQVPFLHNFSKCASSLTNLAERFERGLPENGFTSARNITFLSSISQKQLPTVVLYCGFLLKCRFTLINSLQQLQALLHGEYFYSLSHLWLSCVSTDVQND